MHPVYFEIGNFSVSAYTAFVDLGIILGLSLTCLAARRERVNLWEAVDAALIALLCGIVAGRLAYVGIHWPYFRSHGVESLYLWRGGLSFPGAFWGGVLGLWGGGLWCGWSFWWLADLLAPGLALGQAAGWVGGLLSGYGYGLPSRGRLAYELPDLYGVTAMRFPTQAMMSSLSALVFLLLMLFFWRSFRPFPGFYALFYLLLYSLGAFIFEFTRGDETLYLGILRWSQVVEVGEFILALFLLIYLRKAVSSTSK